MGGRISVARQVPQAGIDLLKAAGAAVEVAPKAWREMS